MSNAHTPAPKGGPGHELNEDHKEITSEVAQQIYDKATRSIRPGIIEYRADGCITWREAPQA